MEIAVLDHGYVRYIEHWGSDERIIEAARMSTNKGFQGWGPKPCPSCESVNDTGCPMCKGTSLISGDEKLLRYLWEHKHYTPFEMAGMTVEVQAPIMVFREWHRHRTQSYNEMSGRYTELPPMYYIPSIDRIMNGAQNKTNKQGSESGLTKSKAKDLQETIRITTEESRHSYEILLQEGLSRELARLVLPVNQYSRMRASANLRNWLAFLSLRLDESAQWEIRSYAQAVAAITRLKFPRTMELFDEGR